MGILVNSQCDCEVLENKIKEMLQILRYQSPLDPRGKALLEFWVTTYLPD